MQAIGGTLFVQGLKIVIKLSTIYYPHDKILLPLQLSPASLCRGHRRPLPPPTAYGSKSAPAAGHDRRPKGPGSVGLPPNSCTVQMEGHSVNSLRNSILPEDSAASMAELENRRKEDLKNLQEATFI